jgi:hypothetical protein
MKTMRTLTLLALAAGSTALASASDFRWSGRIADGKAIEIKGVNGGIEAGPATGNEVEVVAIKTARRDDPDSVEIKLVEHAGGVTICSVYPSSWSGRLNECAPGDAGRMDSRDNDVNVEFEVRVPAGVRFVGRTVNGGIQIAGLTADVEAYTVNGGVKAQSKGLVRAETVNGSLSAALGDADWTGALHFSTVNGSLTVELGDDRIRRPPARARDGERRDPPAQAALA